MATQKDSLRCRYCKRSLRGVKKAAGGLSSRFTERFDRRCPKSSDGLCWRQTQAVASAGSGKSKINIFFNDAAVPSRGASLYTRCSWGSEYLKRLLSGQKANRKSLDLAMKWIDEAIEEVGYTVGGIGES